MGKAQLIWSEKFTLASGLVREAVIWRVEKGRHYPEGLKYRLVLVECLSQRVILLFDNHYPKGHHVHLPDGREVPYAFSSAEILIRDYLSLCAEEERKYASKKD